MFRAATRTGTYLVQDKVLLIYKLIYINLDKVLFWIVNIVTSNDVNIPICILHTYVGNYPVLQN